MSLHNAESKPKYIKNKNMIILVVIMALAIGVLTAMLSTDDNVIISQVCTDYTSEFLKSTHKNYQITGTYYCSDIENLDKASEVAKQTGTKNPIVVVVTFKSGAIEPTDSYAVFVDRHNITDMNMKRGIQSNQTINTETSQTVYNEVMNSSNVKHTYIK